MCLLACCVIKRPHKLYPSFKVFFSNKSSTPDEKAVKFNETDIFITTPKIPRINFKEIKFLRTGKHRKQLDFFIES